MDQTGTFASITTGLLTDLVRRLTSIPTAEVSDWSSSRIYAGGRSAEVYRFVGSGTTPTGPLRWSLILKILGAVPTDEYSSGWNNPQREVLAYRSGLLTDLHGSFVAPRCLGMLEQADGTTWLWLEEVIDVIGATWPLARYGIAAYHLGQFNGRYLAGQALPTHPWLSRRWLRGWLAETAPAIAQFCEVRYQPLVQRVYGTGEHLLRLWAEHERWLDVLERLPQTLCHLDASRRNLFACTSPTGEEQTVAIDWEFVGMAAVGEEVASLVVASVAFGEVTVTDMAELEATAMEGYLKGLRDAGWQADPQEVRLAYCMTAALRLPVGGVRLVLPLILDAGRRVEHERRIERPIEETFDMWGAMNEHLWPLGDEARRLIAATSR